MCVERIAVWREGKGRLQPKAFPAVCPRILLKEAPTNLCCPQFKDSTTRPWHTQGLQCETHVSFSTLLPAFSFPPPVKFLFVCLNAQTPQLSSLSVLIRETKILCYGATFWDKKGRLLITRLLDHWNQSLT